MAGNLRFNFTIRVAGSCFRSPFREATNWRCL